MRYIIYVITLSRIQSPYFSVPPGLIVLQVDGGFWGPSPKRELLPSSHVDGGLLVLQVDGGFWGVWGAYLVRGPKRELFVSSPYQSTP